MIRKIHPGWILFLIGIVLKPISIYLSVHNISVVEGALVSIAFFGDIFSIVGFLFALLDPRLGRMEEILT